MWGEGGLEATQHQKELRFDSDFAPVDGPLATKDDV